MIHFCDCWKQIWNHNNKQQHRQRLQLLDSNNTNNTNRQREAPPIYRCMNRNQCRLLWLLGRITDATSAATLSDNVLMLVEDINNTNRMHDWFDIWDRLDQYNNEIYIVDTYTGRTSLHLALLHGPSSGAALDDTAMWEQVIELLMELNPHALITIDKFNYTPIHLLCNLSKVVQSNTLLVTTIKTESPPDSSANIHSANNTYNHIFQLLIQEVVRIPTRYRFHSGTTNGHPSHHSDGFGLLAITSTTKNKLPTQSYFPPPPLLLACRNNASAETLFWILYTRALSELTWIAPWTGGETIQDIVLLRRMQQQQQQTESLKNTDTETISHHYVTDQLHWNTHLKHETPLETLVLIPDERYGKRIWSMIKIITSNSMERLRWKNVAEQIFDIVSSTADAGNKDSSSTISNHFKKFQTILREFVSSDYDNTRIESNKNNSYHDDNNNASTCSVPTTDDGNSCTADETNENKDYDHICEMRHLWAKCILLLSSKITPVSENAFDINELPTRTIATSSRSISIETLVSTVSCLYRPIPELLHLICTIFPHQLSLVPTSSSFLEENGDHRNPNIIPLTCVLLLIPWYQLEEKRMQQQQEQRKNNDSSSKSTKKSSSFVPNEFSRIRHQILENPKPRRHNLYMHTRFHFGPKSNGNDDDDDNDITGYCDDHVVSSSNIDINHKSISKIPFSKSMESQVRVLVQAQPDALRIPIPVSQSIQEELLFTSVATMATPTETSATTTLDKDDTGTQQQEQLCHPEQKLANNNKSSMMVYPFVLAAIHNCSVDTIYQMILAVPQAVELQRGVGRS